MENSENVSNGEKQRERKRQRDKREGHGERKRERDRNRESIGNKIQTQSLLHHKSESDLDLTKGHI